MQCSPWRYMFCQKKLSTELPGGAGWDLGPGTLATVIKRNEHHTGDPRIRIEDIIITSTSTPRALHVLNAVT